MLSAARSSVPIDTYSQRAGDSSIAASGCLGRYGRCREWIGESRQRHPRCGYRSRSRYASFSFRSSRSLPFVVLADVI